MVLCNKIKCGPDVHDLEYIVTEVSRIFNLWTIGEDISPYEIVYLYGATVSRFFSYLVNISTELQFSLYLNIIVI